MPVRPNALLAYALIACATSAAGVGATVSMQLPTAAQSIDLAARLSARTLRPVNRDVTAVPARPGAVAVAEREGPGVVWIEGSDFSSGTIDLDVRGRDVPQRSFVGVAFGRRDDSAYESVYVRPFNFRNPDATRRQNAVQYMSLPSYDWPRLRQEFPGEFENPVDASIDPVEWVHLRVVVADQTVRVYVGSPSTPTLEVRRLVGPVRGMIGLWAGNNSDGAFANLRITPAG
jgi:hypothetical protein